MDIETDKAQNFSTDEHECGCDGHDNCQDSHDDGCGCGCGCGCGDGPGTQYLTVIENDSELKCQILGIFGCDGHTYIAVLHPIEETVILFRYNFNPDRTIGIEDIVDDNEYEMVSRLFVAMHGSQYEIVE